MGSSGMQGEGWQLQLLDGWELAYEGRAVDIPYRLQRLVAFLALRGPQPRSATAGILWSESDEPRARANLRTTLGRVRTLAPGLLSAKKDPVALAPAARVDVHTHLSVTQIAHDDAPHELSPGDVVQALAQARPLLPGWYDDWVLLERERLLNAHIVALERAASHLLKIGDHGLAVMAAAACVSLEPMRESSHRTLVRVHLANGDRVEAWRVYATFRRRSIREFGLAPGPEFDALIEPLLTERLGRRRSEPP